MLARIRLKNGPGIPLVFLHGLLGTSEDWNEVCRYLPPCNCVGIDLPGHGKSPFIKDFQIPVGGSFHLIGYSMGGRLAMQYADKYPEKIASLTIISAHPGLKTAEEKQKRLETDAAWAKLILEIPIDEFLIRWYDQPIFQPYKPDLSMRKKVNIQNISSALLHYSLAHQARFEPKSVLVGERDEKFISLHKDPILIPNAGHMVHLENPKAVAAEIEKRIPL